ncbi:hypothetical protein ABZ510_14890 [Nocardia rhamnosiphila]|uniref:Uncharacterized protein n=2 Tax=Nocardia rhamnosiphila TaxID=426716 RepID=A0ABV2WQI4_9NOCA
MSEDRPKAVGLIRRDVFGHGIDIHRVAARFGHRIVWTVRLDTGPLASALILAGTVTDYAADAVVVPGFEHADAVRHTVTDLCALITPMQVYPRGYRWPVVDMDRW